MTIALTVKQVAERLNANDRTIYRLAQAGRLPAFKVGDSWRFLEEDIDAWIVEQKDVQRRQSTPLAGEGR